MQMLCLPRRFLILPIILLLWSISWNHVLCSSKVSEDSSQHPIELKELHTNHEAKKSEHQDTKNRVTPWSTSNDIKIEIKNLSDRSHQMDFDFSSLLKSFFQPIAPMFRDDQFKPKMKTLVSLTGVIGPKRARSDIIGSPYGFKESSLTDDFFDFSKMMPFMPKCSIIDVIHGPIKHTKLFGSRISGDNPNLTDSEFPPILPWHHHHHFGKRDLMLNPIDNDVQKKRELPAPKLSVKECDGQTGIGVLGLGEFKLDQESNVNDCKINAEDCSKEKFNSCLLKYLPFIEGAVGGVMFVLVILFIASWKLQKPNSSGIWLNVPFLDKSQFVEKV